VSAVQVTGQLRVADLKEAIRKVIGRHEILRTTFKLLPGMMIPVQVVSDNSDFAFTSHDLTHVSLEDQRAQISALRIPERTVYPEHLPVLHIDLIRCASDNHVLIISLPVLCADRQSLECLVGQIASSYMGSSQTKDTLQYADFAEWKNEMLQAEAGSSGRQYWRRQDLTQLQVQTLSFERRAAMTETFDRRAQPVEISAETGSLIRATLSECEGLPASFALACWQILISSLTGHSDVVVGVAFHGRKFAELDESIGIFSTFVPVRSNLSARLSFDELLQQTRQQELVTQRWSEYFAWDNLAIEHITDGFFPFCFEFRKHGRSHRNDDVDFSVSETDACIDRFKIKFIFEECDDRFLASLQFDANLFSTEDVRRLANQLSTLIEDAAIRPNSAIGELQLLSAEERRQLIVEVNDTDRQYSTGKLVHELFEQQAEKAPDNIAAVFESERLTYGELNARANQLAHYLIRLGVGPDTPVGLCLERSIEFVVGMLGILKAGGAYLPLEPGLPKVRRGAILEEAGVQLLITKDVLATELIGQVKKVVSLDRDAQVIDKESSRNPPGRITDKHLAYVIFTSGSTGRPKGVAVEHRQVVNYVNAISEKLDIAEPISFAMVSTVAADLGNTALFPALCKGGVLHLIEEERSSNPEALSEYFSRNQIDCLKIVPTHLSALLSAVSPGAILPRHTLILGGEACPWSLVEKIKSLSPKCKVLNHYGPTEATVGALTYPLGETSVQLTSDTVPLGRPLGNVQTYILDEELRLVPTGAPGELHIGGAGLARGYISRADATAEKFIPNPFSDRGERLYKTGDRARYLSDGGIEFLGRIDNQLKIHGFRIEPREIEIALRDYDTVTDSLVLAREDDHGNRQLVAYVVARQEKLTASELRTFLKERLPDYMVPMWFVFLSQFPLTRNGKVDRNSLPAPDRSQLDGGRDFIAPRNELEKTLAQIWSNILGVERVSVYDNFFDLGGDSILSIQIIAKASQAGLKLTPRQLFQHQTIADLAMVGGVVVQTEVEQGVVTGSVPLTPVQARFFDLNQAELHHYNQAMLLEVREPADALTLEKVIELLLVHHDALRLRFAKRNNCWEQTIVAPDGTAPFETIDLSAVAEERQSSVISECAARLHTTLNLQNGPLMRVALFDLGPKRNGYLLIVIHHLAVDGVSWRILLEDLDTLFEQLRQHQKPSLPPKTTSFKTWAERLLEHAQSKDLNQELLYWSATGKESARLPVDDPVGENTVASARTVSVSLGVEETHELLQRVPMAYRTQINEVLLTALVRSVGGWTGRGSLLVDLEGHGREEIIEGVDLSRTVGWFTTIFPVLLDCRDSQNQVDALRSVKEQLRNIPNRGIGYGLLRYMSRGSDDGKMFRALTPDIRFNYLGQIDRVLLDSSTFSVARHRIGPAQSLRAERAYLLNIIAMVTEGELKLEWTYSENIHHRETIERVAERYVEELRMLIRQSRAVSETVYSPSDFPNANVSREELSKVLAKIRK
jgi:amino acid adenylation domain-containing protein/non-ribosomal peptide synthase protein (TIGR01720 family)